MGNKLIFLAVYALLVLFLLHPLAVGQSQRPIEPPKSTETGGASDEPPSSSPPALTDDDKAQTEPESESAAPTVKPIQTVQVFQPSTDQTVEMAMSDYLTHVVMAEMPYTFPVEALKAQAVAARTYCLYRSSLGIGHEGSEAGVCTDHGHCMAYLTSEQAVERWGSETAVQIAATVRAAVEQTEGEYLTYDGKIIAAMFHSSSTGRTESAENLWGSVYPYLVGVKTEEEPRISEVRVSIERLMAVMKEKGERDFSSELRQGQIELSFNSTGRVAWLSYGGYRIKGGDLRTALSLRSTDLSACIEGEEVLFTVTGFGHGIGMSQYGAKAMAERGCSYVEILEHYYTGARVTKAE